MAQMNLNTQVTVKLTDYGLNHYQGYFAGLHSSSNGFVKIPDSIGVRTQTFTLWELMEIFGPCLFLGNTQIPFEGNVIGFSLDDVEKNEND